MLHYQNNFITSNVFIQENQHSLQRPNFFDHSNLAHFSTMIRDDLISRENCQTQ